METAGDCYIVAGGLMEEDEDGFTCVAGNDPHPEQSAERVFAFAKVRVVGGWWMQLLDVGFV